MIRSSASIVGPSPEVMEPRRACGVSKNLREMLCSCKLTSFQLHRWGSTKCAQKTVVTYLRPIRTA